MICKHCGAEIADGSAFCTGCGKPVETLAPAPENQSLSEALTTALDAAKAERADGADGTGKSKGFLAPIVTLLASLAGWLYVWMTNSIEGIKAWFVSSQDMQDSLSGRYEYFGNDGGNEEMIGAIVLIVFMVILTVLSIIGVVMLIKRLIRKFAPKK